MFNKNDIIHTMKKYNFDEIIERRGTSCVKHDMMDRIFGTNDTNSVMQQIVKYMKSIVSSIMKGVAALFNKSGS